MGGDVSAATVGGDGDDEELESGRGRGTEAGSRNQQIHARDLR